MAELKDGSKKSSKSTSTKKTTKSTTTKKTTVKKTTKKDNKIAKIGESIIKSYEEPNEDKAAKAKELMKKEDTPKMKMVSQNRKLIIFFIAGLVLGLIIMALFIPDRIAKLENGQEVIVNVGDQQITADNLYNDMKSQYSVTLLINNIDDMILSKQYPEDNDMKTSVNETADYYISSYETYYGYTEEEFLKSNNFKSRDEFITYLVLDYRRNKYYTEYVKGLITDKDIKNYYNSNVYGDISTKYISIDSSKDDASAKKLVEEIIKKLNSGKKYDDVINEYKDKIKYEDLGYIAFDNTLDESYVTALKKLANNTFTTEAVKSDKDYKIIFRGDQKDKQSQDDVKDKIVDLLADQKKKNDSTLYYKALDKMRKDNKVEIKDTDLTKRYNDYIKEYTSADAKNNDKKQTAASK